MAKAMGLIRGSDVADALREINAYLRLPTILTGMGALSTSFDKTIKGALADHCHKTNPRIASDHDYRELLAATL